MILMKLTKNNFLLLTLFFFSYSIFSQTFEWGGSFGGIGETVIRKMYVDDNGNSYTTGYFTDSTDFDISSNETVLISNDLYDVFVQKTNSNGDLVWAVSFGNDYFDYGTAITTDSIGNVYVSGYFEETGDFNPGPEEFILEAQGNGDIFIVKLDSNGEFVWAKTVGGTDYEEPTSIGVDELGNVFVLGYLYGTVDFDPSDNEFIKSSQGAADVFLLKLNSFGEFLDVYTYGGTGQDLALEMFVKSSTEIFLSGYFDGTADLDPRTFNDYIITATDETIGYTMQLDETGAIVNIVNTEGGNVAIYAVEADLQNNIYIAGVFDGVVNFDPQSDNLENTLSSTTDYNGFVLKVSPTGNVEWVRQLSSESSNRIFDIAIGSNGTVNVSGFFGGSIDLNPSSTEDFILTKISGSASDAFLLVLDNNGFFLRGEQFGGVDFIDTHQIGMDGEDNVYISGQFELTVDIDPSPSVVNNVTAVEYRDSYLFKISNDLLNNEEHIYPSVKLFPNPADNLIYLKGSNKFVSMGYEIFNSLGQKVDKGLLLQNGGIYVENLKPGVYTIKLVNNSSVKFVKN